MSISVPSSKGQGQGFAQVFAPTRTADYYIAKKEEEKAEAKEKKAEAKEKQERQRRIEDELKGRLDKALQADIFFTRDKDAFSKKWSELRGQFDGKWEQVYKGDTPEARAYNDAIMELYATANQSKEVKDWVIKKQSEMEKNPQLYTEEDWDALNNLKNTPLNFNVPNIIEDVPYDWQKNFNQNVVDPLRTKALNRKKSGTYEEGDQRISYESFSVSPEERKNQLSSWWLNDASARQKFIKTHQKEIQEKNIDPFQLFIDKMYPDTQVDVRGYSRTSMGGGGKELTFDEGNIQEDVTLKEEPSLFRSVGGEFTARTYQTGKVTSNAPFTDQTKIILPGGKIVPYNAIEATSVDYSTPMLVRVDEKGNILPKGSTGGTPKVVVIGKMVTGSGDKRQEATIYRPFSELKQNFVEAGYNADAIEKSLKQQGAAAGGMEPQGLPRVSSDAEYNKIPKGSRYIAPDGTTRVKS